MFSLFKKKEVIKPIGAQSFAQDGEDVVLKAYYPNFNTDYKGFYVDIGAHHPTRFSNTYIYYEKGWRGINIDATPGSMDEFNKIRPEDTNLEILISDQEGEVPYFLFEEPAFNTCSPQRVSELKLQGITPVRELKIKSKNINDILKEYLPESQQIDFLSIDIEGVDYFVLSTLDFDKYSPKYIIVEELEYENKDFVTYSESEIYKLLSKKGYKVLAKTIRSVIYGR